MTNPVLLTLCFLYVTAACAASDAPSRIYEEYNNRVIQGLPFEEEKKYFTAGKQQEVEEQFPRYMEKMKKSKMEVIELYQSFSRSVAKCKKITLVKETIQGDKALLLYKQTDTCGNPSTGPESRTIQMKKENGWKIESETTSL